LLQFEKRFIAVPPAMFTVAKSFLAVPAARCSLLQFAKKFYSSATCKIFTVAISKKASQQCKLQDVPHCSLQEKVL
jgi:hypothetical protein